MRKMIITATSTGKSGCYPFDGYNNSSICWNRSANFHRSILVTVRNFYVRSGSWSRNKSFSKSWMEGRPFEGKYLI